MSWDLFVQDLPPNARSVADIPDTFKPQPLGARARLIERIRDFAPAVAFPDPAWGHLEGPGFSVEFNLGDEEVLGSFALHLRGDTTAAAFAADLLNFLGYRALDPQSPSGLFEPTLAPESVRRWQEYRNRTIP